MSVADVVVPSLDVSITQLNSTLTYSRVRAVLARVSMRARASAARPEWPAWLSEYSAWHHQHRQTPNARFLMYSCHARMNVHAGHAACGGHGNRIRQILWTLQMAAATHRVLLVDWVSPENLEDYLIPGEVDWRPNAHERATLGGTDAPLVHRMAWPNANLEQPPTDKYVRVTAGMPGCCEERLANRSIQSFHGSIGTLYRFLFRPTAAFRQQVHAARVKLFGAAVPYVSMHVRMGDSADGTLLGKTSGFVTRIKDHRSTLAQAAIGIACISSAAPGHPLFVATDNAALKAALAAREPAMVNATHLVASAAFRRVVVTGCTDCMVNAVHRHNDTLNPAGRHATFVDVALLAGGRDFVYMGAASNYALWAEGWRGLSGNYSLAFPGLGGVNLLARRGGKVVCSRWLDAVTRRGNTRLLNSADVGLARDGVLSTSQRPTSVAEVNYLRSLNSDL